MVKAMANIWTKALLMSEIDRGKTEEFTSDSDEKYYSWIVII